MYLRSPKYSIIAVECQYGRMTFFYFSRLYANHIPHKMTCMSPYMVTMHITKKEGKCQVPMTSCARAARLFTAVQAPHSRAHQAPRCLSPYHRAFYMQFSSHAHSCTSNANMTSNKKRELELTMVAMRKITESQFSSVMQAVQFRRVRINFWWVRRALHNKVCEAHPLGGSGGMAPQEKSGLKPL